MTDRENVINPGFSKSLTVYSNHTSCTCVHKPLCHAWRGQRLTSSVTLQESSTLFSEVSHYAWGFSEADWPGSTGICLSLPSSTEGLQTYDTMTGFSH